jgi:hypothetical protein
MFLKALTTNMLVYPIPCKIIKTMTLGFFLLFIITLILNDLYNVFFFRDSSSILYKKKRVLKRNDAFKPD